jgi:hypothetical protein
MENGVKHLCAQEKVHFPSFSRPALQLNNTHPHPSRHNEFSSRQRASGSPKQSARAAARHSHFTSPVPAQNGGNIAGRERRSIRGT